MNGTGSGRIKKGGWWRKDHFEYDALGNRQGSNNNVASRKWGMTAVSFSRRDNGLNQNRVIKTGYPIREAAAKDAQREAKLFSAVFSVRDMKTNTTPRAETSAKTESHPPPPHTLRSKAVEHRRIEMEIPAEPGELVEVYIEIGRDSVLRSNSVLLYCPIGEPASQQASQAK